MKIPATVCIVSCIIFVTLCVLSPRVNIEPFSIADKLYALAIFASVCMPILSAWLWARLVMDAADEKRRKKSF